MSAHNQMIADATRRFRAGDYPGAEELCRGVLRENDRHTPSLHLLALLATRAGHDGDALALLDHAVSIDGTDPASRNSRGALLHKMGRTDEAVEELLRAVELGPRLVDPHVNLGNALRDLDRVEEAEACYRDALALRADHPGALAALAAALRDMGRTEEAEARLRRVVEIEPANLEARFQLAELLLSVRRADEAEIEYRRVVEGASTFIPAFAGLTEALLIRGRGAEAAEIAERARAVSPDHPLTRRARARVHFETARRPPRLDDPGRDEAFDEAARRSVPAGAVVLTIGAGNGLAALSAGRAGAGRVVVCDPDAARVRVGNELAARNGLGDAVRFLPVPVMGVEVEEDLGGRADVVVVDPDRLGAGLPGTLADLRYALAHSVKPGATVIPTRSVVRLALLELSDPTAFAPVRERVGFDAAPLDVLRSPEPPTVVPERGEAEILTDIVEAFAFDLSRRTPARGEAEPVVTVERHGTAHAAALRFDHDLGAETDWIERDWAVFPFVAPIPVDPGMRMTLSIRHDGGRLIVGLVGVAAAS